MIAIDKLHLGYIYGRRASIFTGLIECLIPSSASVLDLGCSDGLISRKIAQQRKEVKIFSIEGLFSRYMHLASKGSIGEQGK
jgi:2-polyprenyl-3-methyl-5-hydroxy-6-metoxy-1,4-benzoquinol methylase